MDVVPRTRSIPKSQVPVQVAPVQVAPAKEKPVVEEAEVETSQEVVKKSFIRQNMVLIVIFATIIIVLVLVIVWVTTNGKYACMVKTPTINLAPFVPVAPIIATKPLTHTDVVNSASAAELALFANLGVSETPVSEPVSEVPLEQIMTVVDIDATLERSLNAKLDAASSDAVEVSPTLAIDEAVDAEIARVEAEQNKPIEQLNLKTGSVISIFPTSEAVYNANFDYDQVVLVCRGEQKSHKKYGWRYQAETSSPD